MTRRWSGVAASGTTLLLATVVLSGTSVSGSDVGGTAVADPVVTQTPTPTPTPTPTVRVPALADYAGAKRLTATELAELLALAGFHGEAHATAWKLVMRESTGRPTAHNDNPATADDSYGLFQINMRGYLGTARRDQFNLESNDQLLDPVVNVRIAFALSARGTDFGAWGLGPNAYRTGAGPETLRKWSNDYPGEPRLTRKGQ
jgi:hypothetical protein